MRKTTIFAVCAALLFVLPALGTADPEACPWDLDDSDSVGTGDLLELFEAWGDVDEKGDEHADFDADGTVGTSDLLILFSHWGPCPK